MNPKRNSRGGHEASAGVRYHLVGSSELAQTGLSSGRPEDRTLRRYKLRGGEPSGRHPDDPWLKAISAGWDWTTECTIVLDIVDVPPLDAVGKDRALVARYRAAREQWRRENASDAHEAVAAPWQVTG